MCRLFFLFKVVEGLVTAINPEKLFKTSKTKEAYGNFKSVNLVEKHSLNHDRGYEIEQCCS